MELVSTYEPANPQALSFYDQFRLLADDYRTFIIFVCLVAVYYLGFAPERRLPILKTVLLYLLLFIGSLIFSILDVQLPVKSALLVAIAILVLVRVRIKPDNRGNQT